MGIDLLEFLHIYGISFPNLLSKLFQSTCSSLLYSSTAGLVYIQLYINPFIQLLFFTVLLFHIFKMRSSTASLILAFCAMLVVQAAPMDAATNVARSVSGIEARGDFAIVAREDGYNAAGEEVDENGNVVDKRQNNKKNKKGMSIRLSLVIDSGY